jgi:putative flippase GtrA
VGTVHGAAPAPTLSPSALFAGARLLLQTQAWSTFKQTRRYYALRQIVLYGIIGGGCASLDLAIRFLLRLLDTKWNFVNWRDSAFSVLDRIRALLGIENRDSLNLFGAFHFYDANAHWEDYIPTTVGVCTGIVCSFLLNSFFNFKRTDHFRRRAAKFFLVGMAGLALTLLIVRVGKILLGGNFFVVSTFSVFFVAALQFLLNKFFTFSKTKEQPTASSNEQ